MDENTDTDSIEFKVNLATYILDHNPIEEQYVQCYKGENNWPNDRQCQGFSKEIWAEAWKKASRIMVTRLFPAKQMEGCINQPAFEQKPVFWGNPIDFKNGLPLLRFN